MSLAGKKLGLLLSTAPSEPSFGHGLRLAAAALDRGLKVYLYCIDEAVRGLDHPDLVALQERGATLYACAYAAHRRRLPTAGTAVFSGLAALNDLITATDRFVSFN